MIGFRKFEKLIGASTDPCLFKVAWILGIEGERHIDNMYNTGFTLDLGNPLVSPILVVRSVADPIYASSFYLFDDADDTWFPIGRGTFKSISNHEIDTFNRIVQTKMLRDIFHEPDYCGLKYAVSDYMNSI